MKKNIKVTLLRPTAAVGPESRVGAPPGGVPLPRAEGEQLSWKTFCSEEPDEDENRIPELSVGIVCWHAAISDRMSLCHVLLPIYAEVRLFLDWPD